MATAGKLGLYGGPTAGALASTSGKVAAASVTSTHVAGELVVTLWSDLACLSGTPVAHIPVVEQTFDLERRTDQVHRVTFATWTGAAWLAQAKARAVIRTALPNGDIFEWRLANLAKELGSPATAVVCDPVSVDLSDSGLVQDVATGGITYHNLGVAGGTVTPTEAIDSLLLPSLHAKGYTWIERGTVDFTAPLNLSFDSITHHQLIAEMKDKTGGEWQLRRDGDTRYLLDLVSEINGSVSQPVVAEGRNILHLRDVRDRNALMTVVQPRGLLPSNSEERWGIGFAAWKASNVFYTIPTDETTLTLTDPMGGDGPVAFDDQLDGLYLMDTDGDLFQITASATSGAITVDGAAVVANGDVVEIRADANGTLLTELGSPTALGSGGPGRVARSLDRPDVRGERNYLTNPFASTWDPSDSYSHAVANGTQTIVTTVNVQNGPANQVYAVGDLLILYQGASVPAVRKVSTQETADGSGNASIPVDGAVSVNDGRAVLGLHGQRAPDGWSLVSADTWASHRDPSDSVDLTGTFEAVPAKVAGEKVRVRLSNGSSTVHPGDTLVVDATGDTSLVIIPSEPISGTENPDGSAEYDVVCFDAIVGTTPSIGDAVTIRRPSLSARAFDRVIAVFGQGPEATLQTPAVTVRSVTGLSTLWASVGITVRNVTDGTGLDIQAGGGGDALPARLVLRDVGGGSDLASIEMDDVNIAQGSEINVTLRLSHTLTASTDLALRIEPVDPNPGTRFIEPPFTFIRWTMLHLGPDPDVPPIDGSYANELWQEGNRELVNRHQWPSEFEVSVRELSERWGLDPAEPALQLGGKIPLKVPSMGIDGTQRIVGIRYTGERAEDVRLVLSNRFERLSEAVQVRVPPLFVDVSVETDADGKDRRTILSKPEPPTVVGTRRLVKVDGAASLQLMTQDLLGTEG